MNKTIIFLSVLFFVTSLYAGEPIVLNNEHFSLTFSSDGRPSSLVRHSDQRELVNQSDPGEGFYLRTYNFELEKEKIFRLSDLSFDGRLMKASIEKLTWGGTESNCTFEVIVQERYISFKLLRVEGIPVKNLITLKFNINTKHDIGLHPLGAMTFNSASTPGSTDDAKKSKGKRTVSWRYLWARNEVEDKGAFAIQCPMDNEDHDETLLHIWAHEKSLPRPKIDEKWTVERARQWLRTWQTKFAEIRRVTIEGESIDELYQLVDFAADNNLTRVKFHTQTWRGEYWPYTRHMLHLNPELFPGGEKEFKSLCDYAHSKGLDVDIHTISMSISDVDPEYVLGPNGPDKRLASWGTGQLAKAASSSDNTLYFKPDWGVEYPDQLHRSVTGPGHVPFFFSVNKFRIGHEIIEVDEFVDTDRPVWILKGCHRGMYNTKVSDHAEGTDASGYIRPYDQAFTADSRTSLLAEVSKKYADFCNRNGIYHLELDGLEVHGEVPYGISLFGIALYNHIDHPVTSGTSTGAPMPFHMEYWFRSSKGLGQNVTGEMPLALEQSGRRATHPYEVHSDVARIAALGGDIAGLSKPEPMFSLSMKALNTHGQSQAFIDQLKLWRVASQYMTGPQREEILKHYQPIDSMLHQAGRHNESHIIHRVKEKGRDVFLQPFSILRRPQVDIAWGQGQEFGPTVPWQFIQTDQKVSVLNAFEAQEPEFVIQVMPGLSENSRNVHRTVTKSDKNADGYDAGAGLSKHLQNEGGTDNLSLMPEIDSIENKGDHRFEQVNEALEISIENPRQSPKVHERNLPHYPCVANIHKARGLALTVESDGSQAVLVVQVKGDGVREYIVPLDFKGKKDIVIANGTVSWADQRWGWRMGTKKIIHETPISEVGLGFGYVPAKTNAKVKVHNIRLLPEVKSSLINPVLKLGQGSLQVEGRIESDHYLWYTGGSSIAVMDLNWNEVQRWPVKKINFVAPSKESQYSIHADQVNHPPQLAVQIFTFGNKVPLSSASK